MPEIYYLCKDMDVELLAKMIRELIVDHDQVGLPGVGTFFAEVVPATFSDKGYTINPPYRRLSFHPNKSEELLLIDFYASSNSIAPEAAKAYLLQFLMELKTVLRERKTIVLPGLGRLRATRENNFFFVPDEDLDIYPDGFGLESVSLKTLQQQETINISESFAEIVRDIAKRPELAAETEPQSVAEQESQPVPEQQTAESPSRPKFRWWVLLLCLFVIAAVGILAFLILAQAAPDLIDSILYTPEELRIINY